MGGGCVSSTDAFLHAIHIAQERGVRVHCVASGLVASAHTFIILACSSYECAARYTFPVYNGSLGDGEVTISSKLQSILSEIYGNIAREVYDGFLSEKEVGRYS